MDEKLILNDGTELRGHMIETETRLFLYVTGLTMAELFPLLNDPARTERITGEQYGTVTVISGYRRLMSISDEGGGLVSAGLKKQ